MIKGFKNYLQYLEYLINSWKELAQSKGLAEVGLPVPFVFVLTNDPDHGTTTNYRRVFSELNRLGLKVTTAVFYTMENDGSRLAKHCFKGETHTLLDPEYRDLMLELREQGHEIAFHGYSQVSNTREKFIEGLERFKEIFGEYPFTYIEHGGHPRKHPLDMCKRESLAMEGKKPGSPYYVWDIIKSKIKCVWAYHSLINEHSFKKVTEILYEQEGVFFFRRWPLHYLEIILKCHQMRSVESIANSFINVFIGYTHFGYTGYPKRPIYCLENWNGPFLKNAIRRLEKILESHYVINLTIRELVCTQLKEDSE